MKFSVFLIFILLFISFSFGEKVLVYDEEKGIIFVDSKELEKRSTTEKKKNYSKNYNKNKIARRTKAKTDLHLNRKKDPPELYFKSGLKYYQNKNYSDALKNFKYASEKSLKPHYLLWIGKTYRKLNKIDQMMRIMLRIVDDYSESDVADDALFEMAFHNQKNNHYNEAIKLYTNLAEQYPFGLSYSNGDEFLEICRKERQRMRGELLSSLSALGIKAESIQEGCLSFQKKYNLNPTGISDSITVSKIKKLYKEMVIKEESVNSSLKSLKSYLKWAFTAGVIFTVLLVIMIVIFIKLKHSEKELYLMKETLSGIRIN